MRRPPRASRSVPSGLLRRCTGLLLAAIATPLTRCAKSVRGWIHAHEHQALAVCMVLVMGFTLRTDIVSAVRGFSAAQNRMQPTVQHGLVHAQEFSDAMDRPDWLKDDEELIRQSTYIDEQCRKLREMQALAARVTEEDLRKTRFGELPLSTYAKKQDWPAALTAFMDGLSRDLDEVNGRMHGEMGESEKSETGLLDVLRAVRTVEVAHPSRSGSGDSCAEFYIRAVETRMHLREWLKNNGGTLLSD